MLFPCWIAELSFRRQATEISPAPFPSRIKHMRLKRINYKRPGPGFCVPTVHMRAPGPQKAVCCYASWCSVWCVLKLLPTRRLSCWIWWLSKSARRLDRSSEQKFAWCHWSLCLSYVSDVKEGIVLKLLGLRVLPWAPPSVSQRAEMTPIQINHVWAKPPLILPGLAERHVNVF